MLVLCLNGDGLHKICIRAKAQIYVDIFNSINTTINRHTMRRCEHPSNITQFSYKQFLSNLDTFEEKNESRLPVTNQRSTTFEFATDENVEWKFTWITFYTIYNAWLVVESMA